MYVCTYIMYVKLPLFYWCVYYACWEWKLSWSFCACPIVLLQWRHELETFFMKLDVDSDGVVDWVRHVPRPIVLVSATSSD